MPHRTEKGGVGWDGAYFVSVKELRQRWPVSPSTVYRYINKGLLPRPEKITERRVGWPRPIIEKFLEGLGLGPIVTP